MRFGLTIQEWQDLVLSVNVHRKQRRLSPSSAARLIDRALEHSTPESLATELGFEGPTMLERIRRLNSLPDDLSSVVHWGSRRGSLAMSTASELMRLGSEEELREAFLAAVQHAFTREDATQLVQIRRRSAQPVSACVSEVLRSRPRIERRELILGTLVTDASSNAAKRLGNEEAARLLRLRLAREVPEVVPLSLRVGDGRFALLLSEDHARVLRESFGNESIELGLSRLMGGSLES